MAASADVIRRLEAVAARLEAYANNLPAGGSGGAGGGRAREAKDSPAVSAYREYYAAHVVPFINTVKAVKETAYIADIIEKAFGHAGVFIEASTKCKKPPQAELMKFLGPIPTALGEAEKKLDNRSPFFPQQKAISEGLPALNWLVMPGEAKAIVQNGLEQADFYLIKILNLAKTKAGDEQKGLRDFVANFKTLLNKLGEYADEYFPKGIDWNPKGGDLSGFTPGAGAAPAAAPAAAEEEFGGAPPPPPGPPPSADELTGSAPAAAPKVGGASPGMGAVFSAINQGLDVTKGLKKVDASQKTKNMKDVPVLAPKEKKDVVPAKKFGAVAEKKPPKLELSKGTWFCENYEGTTLEIKDVEIKQSVYIVKCKDCTITIPDKIKSISVDGCHKVRIVFRSIVSVFELFNSQRCVAECTEVFPAIAIDKSNGCIVVVSRAGLATPPQVVTSNISECNIQVPGATDEDDPIEIPIPEQYETTLLPGGPPYKLQTKPTAHGD